MNNPIYAEAPEQKEYEIIPAGNFAARCVQMIQLGTHISTYEGKETRRKRLRITWELPTEKMENGKPHVIGQEYTLSLAESGNLLPMLQSWRGQAFTKEELTKFDLTSILSVPCLINVIHTPSKKDATKIYANIANVSSLPKGMVCPDQINETLIFNVEDFKTDEIEKLPKFIQDKIKESIEYASTSIEEEPMLTEDELMQKQIDELSF